MTPSLSAEILKDLPPVNGAQIEEGLSREIRSSAVKFVVLDDDPTGVQTVHDVSVYTDWSIESLKQGLLEPQKLFYVLTNSRGMTAAESEEAHRQIARGLAAAARETGTQYAVISRSDSTLRGHYPLETEVLRQELEAAGGPIDGEILCFFFKEGGRFTIGDVHYVKEGDKLVPAADTEFARDKTFGFRHSSLPEYIEEKTSGRYPAEQVACIPLGMLRAQDYEGIVQTLMQVHDFGKICVNAADDCDLQVFATALYRAMARGKRFLFRTAASFVKAVGGIPDIPLLARSDMIRGRPPVGGLVVAGGHTAKTTDQLEDLFGLAYVERIEFDSDLVLAGDGPFYAEVDRCVAAEEAAIRAGKVAVCYTRRRLLTVEDDTKESALLRSVKISEGVQCLVGRLGVAPAFIVAKGGITSSTIGTCALGVKKAQVLGQIRPGIPVWRTDSQSKFPMIPYVIFPGNVGDASDLRKTVEILMH